MSTENTWAAGYAAALADLMLLADLRQRYNAGMAAGPLTDDLITECAAMRSGADWLTDGGAGVWAAISDAWMPEWEDRRSTPPGPGA